MEDEIIKIKEAEEKEENREIIVVGGHSQRGFGSLLKTVILLVLESLTNDNVKDVMQNINSSPYLLSSISDIDLMVNYNPKFSKLKKLTISKNKVIFKTKVMSKNYIKQHNTKVKSFVKPVRNREF